MTLIEGWKEAQEKVFLGFKDDLQEIKQRITSLDKRLDERITAVGEGLGARITALDQKIEQHFRWTVGIQVAVLLAVLGVLFRIALG